MYQKVRNEKKDEKKIDVSKFFSFKSIVIYVLSILVGVSKLSSGATPFGLALLGAIADSGFPLIMPLLLICVATIIGGFRMDMPF